MKQLVTVYIQAKAVQEWNSETLKMEESVKCFSWPYENYDGARFIEAQVIEVDVPDVLDAKSLQLELLRKEKTKLQAEFTARITAIQSEINKLTAIEG